jgi:hypothetical protein
LEYFRDLWDILWHCVYFVFIWYIFPVLVSCIEKNLATLLCDRSQSCDHFCSIDCRYLHAAVISRKKGIMNCALNLDFKTLIIVHTTIHIMCICTYYTYIHFGMLTNIWKSKDFRLVKLKKKETFT